jgi:Sec-independent protein translocase protein TatA
MNHTIKGILIVAAITSMLVLGATMVPIMQNSFASKKSDFKKAERDPNTNTNTNTNSADSSSSSSATAENTNNINNTNTQAQNQAQAACVLVGECAVGSTEGPPAPPTATCVPPTVGGITATPTDGTCTATIPRSEDPEEIRIFEDQCTSIPGDTIVVRDTAVTCLFESTPPA